MARVTLKDIADEAGVSLMTVSNVVNGNRAKVSDGTIARVLGIIDRLGYVPSASARSLAANASHLVGLLVPAGDQDVMMGSPHSIEVFQVLERHLRDRGYHLLFRGVANPAEVEVALKSWNLDGAVLLGFLDEEVATLRPPAGTPVVALDSYSTNAQTTGVRSDDYDGGRLAAAHLLAHGHRRIVFASPAFSEIGVVRQRFEGFLRAHEDARVPWHPDDSAIVDTTFERGASLGHEFTTRFPDATATFATADILAIGLLNGLRASGTSVPDDVSVVGFDDIDIGRYVTPKLTTIGQNVRAKVATAVDILLAEIDGALAPGEPVTLAVEFVERESVADRR